MRIAMIGSGYVGLVSGACLADFGHDVVAVDNDAPRVAALQKLQIPIYEPGLLDIVTSNVRARRLSFTTDLAAAVPSADVVFLAVGTPSRHGDGYADLSFIFTAAESIAPLLSGFTVVAVKSTVPVGTGDEVERIVRAANPGAAVSVVSNPEFMREGSAIDDFKIPDRVVIGANDDRAREVMAEVYRPLNLNKAPLFFTDRRTSEIIKYAANAFLAMKVTFINEMADLCERVGADVQDVATGMGLDNRIGRKFLHAGPGFGGSCFPKDTLALIRTGEEAGSPLRLVETTVASNDLRKRAMARKIIAALPDGGRGRRVAILGLTFKPNTDDVRDAPSLAIIPTLQAVGVKVTAHDPQGIEQARPLLRDVGFSTSPYDCADGADALVILTEWDAFRALDFERLGSVMKNRVLIDLRNVYRRGEVARHGFRYVSVGRPGEDAQAGRAGAQAAREAAE
jgi:UDPglucose 6-dehydrogenase